MHILCCTFQLSLFNFVSSIARAFNSLTIERKSILMPSTFSSVTIGSGAEARSRQPLSIVMRRDEEQGRARV